MCCGWGDGAGGTWLVELSFTDAVMWFVRAIPTSSAFSNDYVPALCVAVAGKPLNVTFSFFLLFFS